MSINAFTTMACTLVRDVLPSWQKPAGGAPALTGNKTADIRELLRVRGPLQACTIATILDLDRAALVGALLKHDLATGRVVREGNRYALSQEWDDAEREDIAQAIRFLRCRGFTVRRSA